MYVQWDPEISQQILLLGSQKPQDVVETNHPNKAIKKKIQKQIKVCAQQNQS